MKRQQPASPGTSPLRTACSKRPVVMTGNTCELEMLQGYYREKLQELQHRLRSLNLMENAREISAICVEIIRAKKILTC
ncbi:hypothetical protein [Paraflavitalea sp. CAU 1676]|uniref:hypothetical protein n=1 Tax=Paraflavitalea sp. CAU 1676 TaxID=3032598 RepID=UPI0023DCCA07|nr:hypothetical protein [Paraflavitalea sp. CAU 1676]MDF2187038.1 hypothetical protein [Paraflavitalea sp. CAU 1676]